MDTNPIYTDALPYIDVTRPYFALRNLSPLPPSSSGFPAVTGTFIPILGSVAAAYSNPVKAKHYYLALDASVEFVYFSTCQELRADARITFARWEKHRVGCEIEMFTPKNRFAGKMKVSYAVVTEKKLISITKVIDPKRVFGTAWQPGEPSPYMNPIMLRMVKTCSPELVTAIISLHDRRSMAGHFSPIAAAPIAILSSNGIVLCRQLLGADEGKQWLDRRTRVKCQRLAIVGEILEVRARKLSGGDFSHRVEFWDEEGTMMGIIDYLFVEIDVEKEKPRL
ncbi:hypothetical protein JMJ35_007824 [Cladonia borealis]|uniref:Uncharacterized protein n=1 Tax=Cladonia borealis TaxID=184061 RepID=A0AA39V736_9LECA|nr:hypothetical protein JMJ35_007824 [Cladonia borealis]